MNAEQPLKNVYHPFDAKLHIQKGTLGEVSTAFITVGAEDIPWHYVDVDSNGIIQRGQVEGCIRCYPDVMDHTE